jgi:hypothetical protein
MRSPFPEATTALAVASLAVAQQVCAQDLTTTPEGTPIMRQGVAAERCIHVEDAEMRHGRQSRSLLVDGYKRRVLRDVDSRLIVAVGVTPAHAPEASVTDAIETDVAAQESTPTCCYPVDSSCADSLVVFQPYHGSRYVQPYRGSFCHIMVESTASHRRPCAFLRPTDDA